MEAARKAVRTWGHRGPTDRGVYFLRYCVFGQEAVGAVDSTGQQIALIPVLHPSLEEAATEAAWAALEAYERARPDITPPLRAF